MYEVGAAGKGVKLQDWATWLLLEWEVRLVYVGGMVQSNDVMLKSDIVLQIAVSEEKMQR